MPKTNLSALIWSVADLLRGDLKQSEYGEVILPFTVLRRSDCSLEPTKQAVLAEHDKRKKAKLDPDAFCKKTSGHDFYNISPLDLKKLRGDQDNIGENLRAYVHGFSPAVRDIFEQFDFDTKIDRLAKASPACGDRLVGICRGVPRVSTGHRRCRHVCTKISEGLGVRARSLHWCSSGAIRPFLG